MRMQHCAGVGRCGMICCGVISRNKHHRHTPCTPVEGTYLPICRMFGPLGVGGEFQGMAAFPGYVPNLAPTAWAVTSGFWIEH